MGNSSQSCSGGALSTTRTRSMRSLLLYSTIFSGGTSIIYFQNWLSSFFPSWLTTKMRWCPTGEVDLEEAEKRILSYVKCRYHTKYVEIDSEGNKNDKQQIWTLGINTEKEQQKIPLVLVHGFASALGLWVLNLDTLAKHQPLYAFDLLGFGRSSRPVFSKNGQEAENQLVHSIEEWRKKMGLKKFILLGHSLGGFLASSYALQHPEHVAHLILADPWGFPQQPAVPTQHFNPPMWVRIVATMLRPFNPLVGLRIAGPWGPQLVERFRPDLVNKFTSVVDDPEVVPNYIYHCNAQTPSGESAFKAMNARFGWAKNPMITRIGNLPSSVPITFIYGRESWVNSNSGREVKNILKNSSITLHIIEEAGHHVYADHAEHFNHLVQNICKNINSTEQTTSSCEVDDINNRVEMDASLDNVIPSTS